MIIINKCYTFVVIENKIMESLDIIGALETKAIANGWKFIYGIDDFYSNALSVQEFKPNEYILIADFTADPTIINGKITQTSYNCLLMLGRKFDLNGLSASLDETPIQKYDRRLLVLLQTLAAFIGDVACDNELEVSASPLTVNINVFDANIDFAISDATTFVQ